MWKLGRNGRAVVAAAGMITGVTLLAGASSPATADGPVTITADAGILRLRVAANSATATYTPVGGEPVMQSFTVNGQCALTLSPSGPALPMLTFTGTGSGPGLQGTNIGVRNGNSCGLGSAAIISGTEALTVALGSHFNHTDPDTTFKISRAELDVAAMNRANLAVALDAGPSTTHPLPNNRGSAFDAGVKDNNRVVLDAAELGATFRSITLSAVATSVPAPYPGISLNGGGDGNYAKYQTAGLIRELGTQYATAETIFKIVTETQFTDSIECGDTSPSAAIIGGGAAIGANVTWAPPADCGEGDAVNIDFEITSDGVVLEKSFAGLTPEEIDELRFRVEIDWAPVAATAPLPARQISLVPPFAAGTFTDVVWCVGQDLEGNWIHPDGTPWCLISNDEVLNGDGTVTQLQEYDGVGDPMWR